MKNPFRNKTMRAQFDQMIDHYYNRRRILFNTSGSRCMGNSWATQFWRGYDNIRPESWDAASRRLPAYAIYRAGQAVSKSERNTP